MAIKQTFRKVAKNAVLGERREGDEISNGEAYVAPLYELRSTGDADGQVWQAIVEPEVRFRPHGRLGLADPAALTPRFVFGPIREVPYSRSARDRWFNYEFTDNPTAIVQRLEFDGSEIHELRQQLDGDGVRLDVPFFGDASVRLEEHRHVVLGALEENQEKPGYWRFPRDQAESSSPGSRAFKSKPSRSMVEG